MTEDRVKIETDYTGNTVLVWNQEWIQVSIHKYFSDAELVYNGIVKGLSRKDIKQIIKNQDSRCNTLSLKYNQNWH